MVDYQNTATVARDFETLVKLWHIVDGIFIWEFFTTLYYEWDVLRRHRPYGWTICVYSIARVATLMSVILNIVGFDTTSQINCQLWATSEVLFGYLAVISSSLLIVLRIIAIWNMDKIVIAIAIGVWVADVIFAIDGIVRFRSTWSTEANACLLLNLESTKLATFAVFITDIVLLFIMLIGLHRMRSGDEDGTFYLGRLLWNQSLLWFLLVIVAEVPPVVLMVLDLNVPLTLIPQTPCMITATIAATRMYRSLINFCSSNTCPLQDSPKGRCRVSGMPIPIDRMEVTVRTEHDQFPSLSVSTHPGSYKAHEVCFNGDVESGPKK